MTPNDAPVMVGIADKDEAVLDYAISEAERWHVPLCIVHSYVVPPSAMGSMYGLDIPSAYREGAEQVLGEAVSYVRSRGSAVEVSTRLDRDHAPQSLDRHSQGARAMIIGPESQKSWVVRLFEGRATQHLIAHSGCPVVIVPNSWTVAEEDGPIVILIDRVGFSHGPIRYALDEAMHRGRHVTVVQVDAADEAGAGRREHRKAMSRDLERWRARYPDVRIEAVVVRGDPAEVARVSESAVDLLVMGRSIGDPLDWDTAHLARSIVQHSRCPVVVVPTDFDG